MTLDEIIAWLEFEVFLSYLGRGDLHLWDMEV